MGLSRIPISLKASLAPGSGLAIALALSSLTPLITIARFTSSGRPSLLASRHRCVFLRQFFWDEHVAKKTNFPLHTYKLLSQSNESKPPPFIAGNPYPLQALDSRRLRPNQPAPTLSLLY